MVGSSQTHPEIVKHVGATKVEAPPFCSPSSLEVWVRSEDGAWSWQSQNRGEGSPWKSWAQTNLPQTDRQRQKHINLSKVSQFNFIAKEESLSHFRSTEFVKDCRGFLVTR